MLFRENSDTMRSRQHLVVRGPCIRWLTVVLAVFVITQAGMIGSSQLTNIRQRHTPAVTNLLDGPVVRILYCTLTAYTADSDSTGKHPGDPGYGITATGQRVQQGVTVAVDPNVIPYGSRLYITGVGYRIAEDTGGAIVGRHIDVYYRDDRTAIDFGVKRNVRVYVLPDPHTGARQGPHAGALAERRPDPHTGARPGQSKHP